MKKYLQLIPALVGIAAALMVIKRELWFDEALTLLNFVLPLDFGKIYFSYIIPNNQIVYSMMLKVYDEFYTGLTDQVVFWRLLSLACAAGMLLILARLRSKLDENKLFPAILVLSSMCISAIFVNYATALRGYAASWLWISLALYGLYDIFHGRPRVGWVIYPAASLLAAGTVPTNLLALAAAGVYSLAWMKKNFWLDKRFYAVFAVIPASLLFYAPIAGDFWNVCKLGEGFSSRSGAALCVLGMYVASFGLLLIFSLFSMKKRPLANGLRFLIYFMPFAAIFMLHSAPFPRVFVTMLPVLAMLVTDGIAELMSQKWRKGQCTIFAMLVITVQLLLIPGGKATVDALKLSTFEDDFFAPWYMHPRYSMSCSVDDLRQIPEYKNIFISFSADPMPLLFYSAVSNIKRNIAVDLPYNSIKQLAKGSVLILRCDEVPAVYEKRFNGKLRKLFQNRQHGFYELY